MQAGSHDFRSVTPWHHLCSVQVQEEGSPYDTLERVVGYLTYLADEHKDGRQRVRRACLVGCRLAAGFWVVPSSHGGWVGLQRMRATAACASAAVCRCYGMY